MAGGAQRPAGSAFLVVGDGLPLAVPSYIAAFVWLDVAPGLAGFAGAVLVLTLTTFPYVFLPALAALRRIDPALEEVAASLGHGRFAVALLVTVPQVRASVAAGALLVALYVLSDFGAVALMRYEVFTFVIYGLTGRASTPPGRRALSLLLVLLAALLVAAEARAQGPGRKPPRTRRAAPRAGGPPRVAPDGSPASASWWLWSSPLQPCRP